MKNFVFILGLILLLSCNNDGFDVADSGIEYKFIINNKDSTSLKQGDIVIMDLKYTTETDSVLFNSINESNQFKMRIKEPNYEAGIDEALIMMHVGDSAIFKVNAMDFYILSRGMQEVPKFISPNDKLIFYIKIRSLLDINKFKKIDKRAKLTQEEKELDLLNDYLQKANITIQPTNSGLYYVEEKVGSGKNVKVGDILFVNYIGKFIDGQVFDTSYKSGKPIEFKYGYGNVIKGWEEALSYMKKGGKAQLIIPSHLAYGEKGFGPIPPFTSLIFEIELVDIKKE